MATERTIPVIMYHCINEQLDASPHGFLGFTVGEFRAHLTWLRRAGYDLLSVSDLWEWLRAGAPRKVKPAILTFDDGFRDNLEVVAPVLAGMGGRGTVFANPDLTPGSDRPRAAGPWGYLDRDQLRELATGDVLEVQSHTWDHLRVFTGPRVVDVYTSARFDRLWWLVWLLRPELRRQWEGDVRRFAAAIPDGHPVFENDRHLARRRFTPDPEFVASFIARYRSGETTGLPLSDERGQLEDPASYERRARDSLVASRETLAAWTGRPVDHLCFPGGAYHDDLLRWAGQAGYLTFMRSSREQGRNDAALAEIARRHVRGEPPVGLARLSITRDYPRVLRSPAAAYLSASLKLRSATGHPGARLLQEGARRLRDALR